MKKNLLTILLAFISLSLGASSFMYNSNALSQKLGSYDGSNNYKLVVLESYEESTTSLFLDNILIKKTITKISDNNKIITTYENQKKIVNTYKNNLLIKSVSDNFIITYTYQDFNLITKVVKDNDKIIEFTRFYYSNNTLIAILRQMGDNEKSVYTIFKNGETTSLLIANLDNFREIDIHGTLMSSQIFKGDKQLLSSKAKSAEDGSLIISSERNNLMTKEYYNSDGYLEKREIYKDNSLLLSVLKLEYNSDGDLIKKLLVENNNSSDIIGEGSFTNKSTITYYKQSIKTKIEVLENDILISRSIYNKLNQRVETLFKSGKTYCTITYALDDKKILDIIYE
ncbi:MAG: hypothetical protein JJE21_04550 [Spirochaetaceae bacterium]|nr:hypothetical protein [Spirochaetaceae bacterium]